MRELTSHKLNGLNDAIVITVMDEPGDGNACHEYAIVVNPPDPPVVGYHGRVLDTRISFQKGPIAEAGYNGNSNEALLAIVQDRLEGFQSGPYACRENALALTHIQDAMHWLQHRTRERLARGVEGTSAK